MSSWRRAMRLRLNSQFWAKSAASSCAKSLVRLGIKNSEGSRKKSPFFDRRLQGKKMYSKEQTKRIKRDTNLAELAASYGYAIDGRTCRTSIRMKHHSKIIIVATDKEDDHGIFFDVHGSPSGSVIDFVMWQEGVNFGGACKIQRKANLSLLCFSYCFQKFPQTRSYYPRPRRGS